MLNRPALETALRTVPSSSLSGILTRFVFEIHRSMAGSPAGAIRHGGRYNAPGIAALYTSFARHTALEEFLSGVGVNDNDPLGSVCMLSLMVSLGHVLDLTDPGTLAHLETSKAELTSVRIPGTAHPATLLGTLASSHCDGLIVWSAAVENAKNVVIFPERHFTLPYTIVRSGLEHTKQKKH